LSVRKQSRVLGRGTFEFALPVNEAILGYWRVLGDERFLVVANVTDEAQQGSLDLTVYTGRRPVDVLTNRMWPDIGGEPYQFTLEPYGYHWLKL